MHPAGLICLALALMSCSDEGATAGPGGTTGAGGSGQGGSGGGVGGAAAGSGGGAGACNASVPSLSRLGSTFEVASLAQTAPKRNPDVAHDPGSDVYLVVTGAEAISGTFLGPEGQALGTPLAIAQTTAYTQSPSVVYGGGKLLVAWHDNRGNPQPELRARLVSWSGTAPELDGPDFSVSAGGQSYQEMTPALGYSETSGAFLVVWQSVPGDDLRARRVDTAGQPLGAEIPITADEDWQSGAAVAWNSASDEFLVTWAHAGAAGAAVRARRIAASDGSLLGNELELGAAAGTWTTRVAYLPCEARYLVTWVAGGGTTFGRRTNGSGEPDGTPFPFPSGYGYPDGFALAYHPLINTLAAVMHGPSNDDAGIAFTSDGTQSDVQYVTESAGDEGHFNPRIVANGLRNEWLLVTSLGFATIVAQRLGP